MKKGPIYILTCYILWGLLPIFWRTLAALDSLYLLAARIAWSLVFILAVLFLQKNYSGIVQVLHDRKEFWRLTAAGALICVNWGVFVWAVNNGHLLDSSLAYYMNPILAILLGTIVFREKLSKTQWLAVLVVLCGLVVTVVRYGRVPWISLVIGGSFAAYGAVKKTVHVDAQTSLFFETMILTPLALLYMVWSELRSAGALGVLHGAQWLLLPLAGIVTTVPLLFFATGVRLTSMTLTGILMYINPTLQLLIGVFLYHEDFTSTHAILFGFVWTGLVLYLLPNLMARRGRKKIKEETVPCE